MDRSLHLSKPERSDHLSTTGGMGLARRAARDGPRDAPRRPRSTTPSYTPIVASMDQQVAARILAHIDPQHLVDLASDLIRIPSFSPDETPAAQFLADYFRPRGYDVLMQEVEPGRFQTIATLRGTGGGKSLMFNGHLDINSLKFGTKRDPWTPTVDGDRLYGHGGENMKGGVATMITAAEAIRAAGIRLRGDLVIACVVGETQGGEGTHHLRAERAAHRYGDPTRALRHRAPGDDPRRDRALRHTHSRRDRAHQPDREDGERGPEDGQGRPGAARACASPSTLHPELPALAPAERRQRDRRTRPEVRAATSRPTCRTSAQPWSTCTSCRPDGRRHPGRCPPGARCASCAKIRRCAMRSRFRRRRSSRDAGGSSWTRSTCRRTPRSCAPSLATTGR